MSKPFPNVTARLFFRLYCTPPAVKLRANHVEVGKSAAERFLEVSRYPFDEDTMPVATYRWGRSDKKILLHHGWGGSPFHFGQLINALVADGYEVISYDAPAHGQSGGRQSNLVQWMHVLEQVIQQVGPLYAVIGHSLGGLSTALTLARKDLAIPRLVLLSTALSAPVFFNEAFRLFRIHPVVMPHLEALIHRRLKEGIADMDLQRYIGGIKAGRIWLAYDTTDTLVDAGDIDQYLQQYPAIQSLRVKGDGHFRIMRHNAVLEGVLQFLQQEETAPSPAKSASIDIK
ncbi:alpha/beta hydrolase [Chitinophaga nivalis]|uniref:Alpha/beta fold hydrolase n=1 Tax=Chitinophaga nivalis TaxID=2991709 RepID=A0ABT3IS28_9BACT|nr:alpha/beta hydrolase [Chitinophaga nivalis]MCW3463791.1 alpha/beta fold hydrolase [Chitinophaga nivalis]MCW3486519.1 alpha/beta fold hydrolase [Chitinophaga nivalis]